MSYRTLLAIAGLAFNCSAVAEGLDAQRLAVLYKADDPASRRVALYYSAQRSVPAANVLGIRLPNAAVVPPESFASLRTEVLNHLPAQVQSLVLIWSKPYAVGCMSITSAFAAGYRAEFCRPDCARTPPSLLFNAAGWLPADTVGWWPAMLLPSEDEVLAKTLIQRGKAADGSSPPGTVYLVRTSDTARNVRAANYADVELKLAHRLSIAQLAAPVSQGIPDAIGYFTGAVQVEELPRLHFRPGAVADHLTSSGGVLEGGSQMSALAWIKQGATATYGAVSEPCNILEKFPDISVLLEHLTQGETVLEAYWKSVAMPGQGLFIGEPLARPFARHER